MKRGPGQAHTGCPQAMVSIKQKRHGEHDGVTATVAERFRSALSDRPISSSFTSWGEPSVRLLSWGAVWRPP